MELRTCHKLVNGIACTLTTLYTYPSAWGAWAAWGGVETTPPVWVQAPTGGLPTPLDCSRRASKIIAFLQANYLRLALIWLRFFTWRLCSRNQTTAIPNQCPNLPTPGGSSTTANHRNAPLPGPRLFQLFSQTNN